MTRAVVFAYHDVGVRCLRALLAAGVEVSLVVTHEDQPGETIWFDSVARHAGWHGIPVLTPEDPNARETVARVQAADPDFIFSFYYRRMLKAPLLALARRGAFNMHGSLLPRYRGRAPVNWVLVYGEQETGATLHRMVEKPDAGAILGQEAVPILPDDTAVEVFHKVTVAAELVLWRYLPGLLAGTASEQPQDLARGSYFGGRSAADGAIDWRAGVRAIHNLVRAVAPPYPGAFSQAGGLPLRLLRTLPAAGTGAAEPVLYWRADRVWAACPDGLLQVLEFELDGTVGTARAFHRRFGSRALPLINSIREPT
ncbi:MAG: formyltransferase [Gammaproteobacteria bacterium]